MGERPKSFIFYDLETSGKSPKYDQPLQFAAIVTDERLKELKRVNVRCKLAPHILPSPIALHITGVYPAQLYDDKFLNAFEFAQFLQSFVKENSPATWIGYNSMAFDENFLRQFFYQNLQPDIYATQSFGNDRLDVMKIIWAVYDECSTALEWPLNEKGKVSFKLEHLAPANGFLNANSHDALSDVEATIHLMKTIWKKAPELVEQLIANRQKNNIKALVESQKLLKVTLRYGGPPKTIIGCFCGYQTNNHNRFGLLDLGQENVEKLIAGSYEEVLRAVTNSPQKIKCLALNTADTIRAFQYADQDLIRVSLKVAESEEFKSRVGNALAEKFSVSEEKNKTVEDQIYDSFISSQDKRILFAFQGASWSERQYISERFEDIRLKILARRLITFYGPNLNYANWEEKFIGYLRSKWVDSDADVEWYTFADFDKDLELLRSSDVDNKFIKELETLKFNLLHKCQAAKF